MYMGSESEIKSIEELVSVADQYQKHDRLVFRGQSNVEWGLKTTLERTAARLGRDSSEIEGHVTREFQRQAPNYALGRTPADSDTFEWMSLLRHYGGPSRLLDFTHSFWIAVFMGFQEAKNDFEHETKNDFSVFVIDKTHLDSERQKVAFPVDKKGKKISDMNQVVIKIIDGSWQPESPTVFSDASFYSNPRFACQQGDFLFSTLTNGSFETALNETSKRVGEEISTKIIIAGSLRKEIGWKLQSMNISSQSLFPGLDGFASTPESALNQLFRNSFSLGNSSFSN